MYGWNSGPAGAGDNTHINRRFGRGQAGVSPPAGSPATDVGGMAGAPNRLGGHGGLGWGGGLGGGRMMRPLMQAWQQQYPDQPRSQWRGEFRDYMQSQPVQDWRQSRPQRPEGGWGGRDARQAAFTGWYNQAPDAPWGPIPDYPTPPAGGGDTGGGFGQAMQGFGNDMRAWARAAPRGFEGSPTDPAVREAFRTSMQGWLGQRPTPPNGNALMQNWPGGGPGWLQALLRRRGGQ